MFLFGDLWHISVGQANCTCESALCINFAQFVLFFLVYKLWEIILCWWIHESFNAVKLGRPTWQLSVGWSSHLYHTPFHECTPKGYYYYYSYYFHTFINPMFYVTPIGGKFVHHWGPFWYEIWMTWIKDRQGPISVT